MGEIATLPAGHAPEKLTPSRNTKEATTLRNGMSNMCCVLPRPLFRRLSFTVNSHLACCDAVVQEICTFLHFRKHLEILIWPLQLPSVCEIDVSLLFLFLSRVSAEISGKLGKMIREGEVGDTVTNTKVEPGMFPSSGPNKTTTDRTSKGSTSSNGSSSSNSNAQQSAETQAKEK